MRLPQNRSPETPGHILAEYLKEYGLSQRAFAAHIGWDIPKTSQIITGKRKITPATALDLADVFGTTPGFWLNAQAACDLWIQLKVHQPKTKLVVA